MNTTFRRGNIGHDGNKFKAHRTDAGFDDRNFLSVWNQFPLGRNQNMEIFSKNKRNRKSNN